MKCPKCSYEFELPDQTEPAVCPECGVVPDKFRQVQKAKLESIKAGVHPRQIARVKKATPWYVTALAFLAPMVVFGMVALRPADQSGYQPAVESTSECGGAKDAYYLSQLFVEKRLKSPRTAEFPGSASSAVRVDKLDECIYQVTAYVDSQNSFGALLRTGYSARMIYTPETDRWQALELVLFD